MAAHVKLEIDWKMALFIFTVEHWIVEIKSSDLNNGRKS